MNNNDQSKPNTGQNTGHMESLRRTANDLNPKDLDHAINLLADIKKRKESQTYVADYFSVVRKVISEISMKDIEDTVNHLVELKTKKGRLFLLGVGGSAANCSHAVNDFRKIANIETYTPVDNVSELTARTNDDGWDTIFSKWLKGSNLTKNDAIMVFSVGGGNIEKNISTNIVKALQYGKEVGAIILGIVSRDGGYTRKVANTSILVPITEAEFITPIAESFQAVIWHVIATHSKLRN